MPLSKPQRKQWNDDAIMSVISAVSKRELGFKAATELHNVPRSTLQIYYMQMTPLYIPKTFSQLCWDARQFCLDKWRTVYSITVYTWMLDILVCRLQMCGAWLIS
jgi:hypothetical protein